MNTWIKVRTPLQQTTRRAPAERDRRSRPRPPSCDRTLPSVPVFTDQKKSKEDFHSHRREQRKQKEDSALALQQAMTEAAPERGRGPSQLLPQELHSESQHISVASNCTARGILRYQKSLQRFFGVWEHSEFFPCKRMGTTASQCTCATQEKLHGSALCGTRGRLPEGKNQHQDVGTLQNIP